MLTVKSVKRNIYFVTSPNTTDAPYINNTLIGNSGLLYTQSYSPEHPSQPNYLDLFSGSDQGITGDYFPTAP